MTQQNGKNVLLTNLPASAIYISYPYCFSDELMASFSRRPE